MQDHALVYPMFAMVLLTFVTLLRLFRIRANSVREGSVKVSYFSTYQEGSEPQSSAQLARHFTNLFEAPTLFYVACLAAMVLQQTTTLIVVLSWMYVLARMVHTFIHTGSNTLNHRIAAYFSSWAILIVLWGSIVVGVSTSAG